MKEGKDLQIEPKITYRKYKKKIRPHISGRSSDQPTQLEHLSHLESHYRSRSQNYNSVQCIRCENRVFYVVTIQRMCLFTDDLYVFCS
jgi:hypothetical protein